jgi:CDP-glycerol glycerophosphotransferase
MAPQLGRLRLIAHSSLREAGRRAMSLATSMIPVRRRAVVLGPANEGNAIEVLRWLDEHYDGLITWLLEGEASAREASQLLRGERQRGRVKFVRRRSLRGVYLFLTSELVFFTSIWFGGPRLRGRRLAVNLWHGDGPKTTTYPGFAAGAPADLTVSGTAVWGRVKVEAFGGERDSLVVCGNPRIDQYDRPATDQELEALGLDPSRKLVLWAPTFRVSRKGLGGIPADRSAERVLLNSMSDLRLNRGSVADAAGVQVVIKPHPLERTEFDLPGVTIIRDADLLSVGISLYQLIARTAALVTDYSSVWSDYLPLERPIGLFCPDLSEYAAGRGFNVAEFDAFAPGPILCDAHALESFLDNAVSDPSAFAAERRAVVGRLGAVTTTGATVRLMDVVGSRISMVR